jgi:anti-sigma B factor antagonist
MPGPDLGIEVTVSGETATVILRGALEPAAMPLLAARLAQVLADGPRRLVLDLRGVTYMDCASARLIAGAGRHLPAGVRPAVRFPGPVVRRVLALTRLADRVDMGPASSQRCDCTAQVAGESALPA